METKIAAIIRNSKDELLLAKEKAEEKQHSYYLLPGGRMEKGEDDEKCLERELQEELQVYVRCVDRIGEYTLPTIQPGLQPIHMVLYDVKISGEPAATEEVGGLMWLEPSVWLNPETTQFPTNVSPRLPNILKYMREKGYLKMVAWGYEWEPLSDFWSLNLLTSESEVKSRLPFLGRRLQDGSNYEMKISDMYSLRKNTDVLKGRFQIEYCGWINCETVARALLFDGKFQRGVVGLKDRRMRRYVPELEVDINGNITIGSEWRVVRTNSEFIEAGTASEFRKGLTEYFRTIHPNLEQNFGDHLRNFFVNSNLPGRYVEIFRGLLE